MMTHMGDVDEELDEGVVTDQLQTTDISNLSEPNFLQFSRFDKSLEQNWGMLSHKNTAEEMNSQTHMSPGMTNVSDLTSVSHNI